MPKEWPQIIKELSRPLDPKDIEWRVSRVMTTKKGPAAIVLAYVNARAVMDRLDEVVGSECWEDTYKPIHGPGNALLGMICELSITGASGDGAETVTKSDSAGCSDIEPVKGATSDAFKRAFVKFGGGRYLYHIPESWVGIQGGKEGMQNPQYINTKTKNGDQIQGYWDIPQLSKEFLP